VQRHGGTLADYFDLIARYGVAANIVCYENSEFYQYKKDEPLWCFLALHSMVFRQCAYSLIT
jgi:hypothetical protein